MNLFKKKVPPVIVLKSKPKEGEVEKLEKAGYVVITVEAEIITPEPMDVPVGDGSAEFLGSGTEKEFLDSKREDDGTDPWYKRLSKLI